MAAPAFVATVATNPDVVGASSVATLPTYVAGDIVILEVSACAANSGGTITALTAAGWTVLDFGTYHTSGPNDVAATLYKVMTGAEGATVTVSVVGGTSALQMQATSYRCAAGLAPALGVPATGANLGGASSSFTSIPLTTVSPNSLALGVLYEALITSLTNFVATGGATERYETNVKLQFQDRGQVMEEYDATSPGLVTLGGSWNFNTNYRAVFFELKQVAVPNNDILLPRPTARPRFA